MLSFVREVASESLLLVLSPANVGWSSHRIRSWAATMKTPGTCSNPNDAVLPARKFPADRLHLSAIQAMALVLLIARTSRMATLVAYVSGVNMSDHAPKLRI